MTQLAEACEEMRLDAVRRMSRQDDAEGKSLQVKHKKTSRSLVFFALFFFLRNTARQPRPDAENFFFRRGTERSRRGHLLHGLEESLAVVLEGHDELQLSSSRLHRCRGKTDNNKKKRQTASDWQRKTNIWRTAGAAGT